MVLIAALLFLPATARAVPATELMAPPLLDVFVLPHAHCDTGWLETVEGYYNSSVRSILMTVTEALFADANRTFIWSEVVWLQMWWREQDTVVRERFRSIVSSGQFEFVGGGWSQAVHEDRARS